MSLTKGRIERTGRIVFHDAALHVWEDGISDARDAGGYEGGKRWERQFKRDVFARIIQALNRLGWNCAMPTIDERDVKQYGGNVARWSAERKRFCMKGDLKADLSISGRCIEFKMFQSINTPTRPDHDGRYESDKEACMPYAIRLEMERTRRRIRDYLCNVFTGYEFDAEKHSIYRKPLEKTALERIHERYAESWHFKGDWPGYLEKNGSMDYNRKSADGAQLEHGQRVWFADRKGRIVEGTAYYNINNMWWVVMGRYDYTNEACFELYTKCPENPRIKRNAGLRRKRLERELAKAVERMDFERAAVLRDIAFPGNPQLFNVWHDEHKLYHCAGFCGYTSDQSKAGKFTADEVKGWSAAPNRVIEFGAAREAA
jgi:hypothetical protein